MKRSAPSTWCLRSACAFAVFTVALPIVASAACQVETLELPVKMVGSRAVATVGINGTPVPLTVDSGAFFSFLTDAAAAQLQLHLRRADGLRVEGLTGRVETQITTVDKLQLLDGEIPRVQFAVGGNEPGAGTMGLLGRNILSFTDTEYDLAHGMIRFLLPNDACAKASMAYWAGATPVTELELVSDRTDGRQPAIRAPVKLNGVEFVALFDTGATTIVSTRAARRAGVTEADTTTLGTFYGAGRGSAKGGSANFETFEIGGETIRHNRLLVADFDTEDIDMLLGIDFFLSHRIYVSKRQSKMFFTYNGGPVFALNKGDETGAVPFDADPSASGAKAASADQLARRGAALAARGNYNGALADLDQACRLEPGSASFLAQRGAIYLALEQPAKALEDVDTALRLDPAQVGARAERARLRVAAKDRAGALADLDVLDKTLAPQAQLRLRLSELYLTLDRPAQTLAQLDQWLPAHPNEIERGNALNSRCWSRLRLGIELDKALDDCDEAIDSDASKAHYWDSRGWVHLRLGDTAKAVADFDRSLELNPGGAWSLYGRGLTKTRMGDATQGDADLVAARKVQPDIDAAVVHDGLMPKPPARP